MTTPRHAGTHRRSSASRTARLGLSLIGVALVSALVAFALHSRPDLHPTVAGPSQDASTPPSASASPGPEETGPEPTTSASVAPTTAARPTPSRPPDVVAAPQLALLVLNNSRINRLATRAAEDFRAGGWPVRGTGNFRGRIAMTTVYYGPGQEASARRLAAQFPKVRRVAARFTGLPGSGLTVVVTRDYTG